MVVKNRHVPIADMTWMVHDDDLGDEIGWLLDRIALGVGGHVPSFESFTATFLTLKPTLSLVIGGTSLLIFV